MKNNIIVVKDIDELEDKIVNYDSIVSNMPKINIGTNVKKFVSQFENIVNELVK